VNDSIHLCLVKSKSGSAASTCQGRLTRVNAVRARTWTFISFTSIPSHRPTWVSSPTVTCLFEYIIIIRLWPSHIHPFPILYPLLCACPHFPSLQLPFDSSPDSCAFSFHFHIYASSRFGCHVFLREPDRSHVGRENHARCTAKCCEMRVLAVPVVSLYL
jgi:hypothetical protein